MLVSNNHSVRNKLFVIIQELFLLSIPNNLYESKFHQQNPLKTVLIIYARNISNSSVIIIPVMQQYIKFQIGRIRCPLWQTVPLQSDHPASKFKSDQMQSDLLIVFEILHCRLANQNFSNIYQVNRLLIFSPVLVTLTLPSNTLIIVRGKTEESSSYSLSFSGKKKHSMIVINNIPTLKGFWNQ